MNENAKKWVEALRSGDYSQAKGWLRREDRFCCLGIACNLHAEATGNAWETDDTQYAGEASYLGSGSVLPPKVQTWLGLTDSTGGISDDQCLSGDNDIGHTFEQIADTIEANEGVLFNA